MYTVTPNYRKHGNSVNLVKTFVENDPSLMEWQYDNVLDEEELVTLSQEQKNEIMMDRIISPHMAAGENSYKQPYKVIFIKTKTLRLTIETFW